MLGQAIPNDFEPTNMNLLFGNRSADAMLGDDALHELGHLGGAVRAPPITPPTSHGPSTVGAATSLHA